jgi:tRNA-(ms[2]io[6]A)-hydroxylase
MIAESSTINYPSIDKFLLCSTPKAWLDNAIEDLPTLLIDHAHCELKAASTALSLIFRYPQHQQICIALSKLAREELLHFEKVMEILSQRNLQFQHLSASRYASELLKHKRQQEPGKLIDVLIIGSIIEARSCERFQSLLPYLDAELSNFYKSLIKSEARHYSCYIEFAHQISPTSIERRVQQLLEIEKALILQPDQHFRFHSGT